MISSMIFCFIIFLYGCGCSLSYNTCRDQEVCEHLYSEDYLMDVYYSGLRRVTANAHSTYCKQYIEFEFMKYFRAMTEEAPLPFENIMYHTQCKKVEHSPLNPITKKTVSLTYPSEDSSSVEPARSYTDTKDPIHLSILYVILVHNSSDFALRLIDALDERTADNKLQHSFVVHVDRPAEEVQQQLISSTEGRDNIHILSDEWRETISWGGFSIVNATLNCMRYAFQLGLPFDFVIDLSGTHYPIKSNHFIRSTLANNLNTIFMDVMAEPNRPESHMWQHYVECDGSLHRIARMPLIKGINMHVGSQWFALPHHAVVWLLRNHLPRDYIQYAKHIIIADENYFSSMIKNSPYCGDALNRNLLFVLFDKFEHERNSTTKPRDNKKCLSYDPDNCGRSPTSLTMEFKYLIGSSRSLFARKFDPQDPSSLALVDYIDQMRGTHIDRLTLASTATNSDVSEAAVLSCDASADGTESCGEGSSAEIHRIDLWDTNKGSGKEQITMIKLGGLSAVAANKTSTSVGSGGVVSSLHQDKHYNTNGANELLVDSSDKLDNDIGGSSSDEDVSAALCMEYAPLVNNLIGMMKCDPSNSNQWFQIGRCTEGYEIQLHEESCPTFQRVSTSHTTTTDEMIVSDESVFCSLLVGDYSEDLCMDISGESATYNNPLIGYGCTGRWNQLFRLSSDCTVRAIQPAVIGRVRGSEADVELCVEATATNHLVTAACYDAAGVNSGGENSTEEVVWHQSRQQFQYLPAEGTLYKKYMMTVTP